MAPDNSSLEREAHMTRAIAGKRIPWVVLLLLFAATSAAGQDRLAITSVTIVDVTDGSLHTDQTVLVVGDRIAAVGGSGDVAIPAETAVVEGRGGYLIPGLWDMHAHVTTDDGRVESFMQLLLANGITGVRDPFGSLEVAAGAGSPSKQGSCRGLRG
jgi:adenine deaminase